MEVKVLTKAQCARAQQKLMRDTIQEGVRVKDDAGRIVTIYRLRGSISGARCSGSYAYPYLLFVLHRKRRERVTDWQPSAELAAWTRSRWPGFDHRWEYAYWLLPAPEAELMIETVRTRTF